MEIRWEISDHDVSAVKRLVAEHRNDFFIEQRIDRNLRGNRSEISPENCWLALLMCLLTTQQRSGPQSPVNRFLAQDPFPITLEVVSGLEAPSATILRALESFGGIRRTTIISEQAADSLPWFAGPQWPELMQQLESLADQDDYLRERRIAEWLATEFRGLGPKQSRNFLQSLGLTRYEIPIDSRVIKWLNDFGFPISLGASALSDRGYYAFVNDGIRLLCEEAGTYPCVLDGIVFSMVDGDGWTGRETMF